MNSRCTLVKSCSFRATRIRGACSNDAELVGLFGGIDSKQFLRSVGWGFNLRFVDRAIVFIRDFHTQELLGASSRMRNHSRLF